MLAFPTQRPVPFELVRQDNIAEHLGVAEHIGGD